MEKTILNNLKEIAALNWERDEDNAGGYVASVSESDLPALRAKLEAAGYDVSDSVGNIGCDDEGQHYLWVMNNVQLDQNRDEIAYEYRVVDGDGNSGPSEWDYPDNWASDIAASSPDEALIVLVDMARKQAHDCGGYYDGDQITCYIYHDAGTESEVITLDLPESPRPESE